ncbi:MAG: hypothetical protein ILO10_06940 [Kiritimatiellae bacterium]|nr:hypothetical protein [Kiritimatiellia bacterium]
MPRRSPKTPPTADDLRRLLDDARRDLDAARSPKHSSGCLDALLDGFVEILLSLLFFHSCA